VLFDMDGLLVNTEPLWFEVEHAVMARLGGRWTAQDQQALVGGSLHRSVDYLLRRARNSGASSTPSHAEVAEWLVDGMADLLAEREAVLMPGALDLLAEVRQAGIPRILVTSSERVIMDAVLTSLARHDIAFTATVCGADVREPKPDPEPYLLAAERLGAKAPLVLEDSEAGQASGRAAGFHVVAIKHPSEIPALLRRLAPSLPDRLAGKGSGTV